MSEHCSLTMSESEGPGCYGRAHLLERRLSLATQPRDPTRLQLGVSNLCFTPSQPIVISGRDTFCHHTLFKMCIC